MRRRRLFVFGCSLSDYTITPTCYGQELAAMLDYEYHHHARGGSGLDRAALIFYNLVRAGEITPDDLVIIQPTERARAWLPYSGVLADTDERLDPVLGKITSPTEVVRSEFGEFLMTNFKPNSYTWQTEHGAELHSVYERNNISEEYFNFKLAGTMFAILSVARAHNINLIVYWPRFIPPEIVPGLGLPDHVAFHEWKYLPPANSAERRALDLGMTDYPWAIYPEGVTKPWDASHFSVDGHRFIARSLRVFIKETLNLP